MGQLLFSFVSSKVIVCPVVIYANYKTVKYIVLFSTSSLCQWHIGEGSQKPVVIKTRVDLVVGQEALHHIWRG